MHVRAYNRGDLRSINAWLTAQETCQVTEEQLPKLGLVVPGVAAAFIIMCEQRLAIMDSLDRKSVV